MSTPFGVDTKCPDDIKPKILNKQLSIYPLWDHPVGVTLCVYQHPLVISVTPLGFNYTLETPKRRGIFIYEYLVFGSLVVKRCSVKAFIVSSSLTRRVIPYVKYIIINGYYQCMLIDTSSPRLRRYNYLTNLNNILYRQNIILSTSGGLERPLEELNLLAAIQSFRAVGLEDRYWDRGLISLPTFVG